MFKLNLGSWLKLLGNQYQDLILWRRDFILTQTRMQIALQHCEKYFLFKLKNTYQPTREMNMDRISFLKCEI